MTFDTQWQNVECGYGSGILRAFTAPVCALRHSTTKTALCNRLFRRTKGGNALTRNEPPPARAWAGAGGGQPKQCPWCFFGAVLPKAGFYEIITANHGADRVVSPITLFDS